ncbi:MAG TPA: methionine--tRNA ligase subunit beta [Candidatus Nanoarchaeia archaeon]|nr:methionine--tRNA ligase subunit beta [Candidatus Nanoarchaeia archaeon]
MKPTINFDDFLKLDLRVGEVLKAEEIPDSDKLWKLTLDVGKEVGKRIVCAGIKEFYSAKELKGRKLILIANLQPRKLKGIVSEGMILAADDNGIPRFLTSEKDVENGSVVR